jgi:hypothetical protein
LVRLSRRARRWPRARIGDLEALLSDGFGPALLGPVHARIVVPRALLAHDPGAARIACVHEDEHRRAGDAWLLLGGALAAAVAPWNPAIWWQLSRLRLAMEVDCDRRVLRRGVPRATYAALLLELGTRAPGAPLQVATLARPTSMLERRLSTMMRNDQSGRPLRAACLTAAAVILTATACEAPEPVAVRIDEQDQPADVTREQDGPLSRVGTSGVPLVYLDGVRFEGDLDALDRQDIARVEIVKGEAAAARYGLAARGGVIRIFTHAATGVGAASPSS